MGNPAKQPKTSTGGQPAKDPPQKRRGEDLTCSESEIEDLLSEGESAELITKGRSRKPRPKARP